MPHNVSHFEVWCFSWVRTAGTAGMSPLNAPREPWCMTPSLVSHPISPENATAEHVPDLR